MPERPRALNHEWLLSPAEVDHFYRLKERCQQEDKPMVLWGWKRDEVINGVRTPNSRTVYFSADLIEKGSQVHIDRAYFFLGNRAKREEILFLEEQVGQMDVLVSDDPKFEAYSRFRMELGIPNEYDLFAVKRRLKGQPRLYIPPPRLIPETGNYDISSFIPLALCIGSGLSAESGLPFLGSIHNLFEVDNAQTGELIFGAADGLPGRMAADQEGEFRNFCQFTIDAIKAQPSESHKMIADLHRQGIIRQVLTDNMDDILRKVDVPYTRTRLSIFPDRFSVKFDPEVKALLVIGVAVDRRDVIKQARRQGLKIITINPVLGVAPHSRNMDYLCPGDIFYKETAGEALPKIVSASGF